MMQQWCTLAVLVGVVSVVVDRTKQRFFNHVYVHSVPYQHAQIFKRTVLSHFLHAGNGIIEHSENIEELVNFEVYKKTFV